MKKLILTSLCVLFVAGTAQADLDIGRIYMTSCKDYVDGTPDGSDPWTFEIWLHVDPGTLHHIDVTPPAGGLAPFTIYGDGGEWWYDSPTGYSSLSTLQTDYPVGTYTMQFHESDDTLLNTIELDYTSLSEPGGPVSFTYPTYGATDVPINPTLEWDVNSDHGDALAMWLDNDDWYENVPASMATTSWGPLGPLQPNHDYYLEVSVINVKDIEEGPAFPTDTVGGDEFEYCLMIEYLNETEFTTVPEPATICLFGLGALSLFRRKRRA